MQEIKIGYLKEALSYDPESGALRWKERPFHHFSTESGCKSTNARYAGMLTGSPNTHGYLQVGIEGRLYLAHRLCWALHYGVWPDGEIDHVSGVKTDNRISNLRVVTLQANCKNKRIYAGNKSGVSGVSWYASRSKWRAKINVNGKVKHVGYFSTIEEAKEARGIAEAIYGYHRNHGSQRLE